MIEIDPAPPILLSVTVVTAGTEVLAVRTRRAMTAAAIRAQLLSSRVRGVTDVAIQLGVYPLQRELGLRQMIVLDGFPHLVVVAVGALGAEASRVRVHRAVATVAVLRDLVLVHAAAVTPKAVQLRVSTEKGKTSLPFVIELCCLPFDSRMALAALRSTFPTMRIVS